MRQQYSVHFSGLRPGPSPELLLLSVSNKRGHTGGIQRDSDTTIRKRISFICPQSLVADVTQGAKDDIVPSGIIDARPDNITKAATSKEWKAGTWPREKRPVIAVRFRVIL